MDADIEGIIEGYDKGEISRRELIVKLAAFSMAMSIGSGRASAEAGSTFRASGLNHIALNTPDVEVSSV